MLKRITSALLLAAAAFTAHAQSTVVSGINLKDSAGNVVTGTLTLRTNDCNSHVNSLQFSGSVRYNGVTVLVSNGSYSATILTPNFYGSQFCYQVGVYNTATGLSNFVSGLGAYSPAGGNVSLASAATSSTAPDTSVSPTGLGSPTGDTGNGNGGSGTPGPTGPAGQGFNYRGSWAASTVYAPYDVFTNAGSSYIVTSGYTSGASFGAIDTSNSHIFAAAGANGSGGNGGSAFNFRGAWTASTAYAVYDVYTNAGSSYIVTSAYTSGGSFGSTDTSHNQVLALVGATGAQGTPGTGGSSSPATSTTQGTVQLGIKGSSSTLANVASTGDAGDLTGTLGCPQDPLLGANSICITAAPYNASPNGGTITTTSGAVSSGATAIPVASCNTFVTGNGFIAGSAAPNTVASCVGTTLTATTGLSTSVASGSTIKHEDYAAVQAATTALAATGGVVIFPYGTYHINGPLQDTSGANSVIKLPSVTANVTGQPPLLIEYRGVRRTSQGNNYNSSTILTNVQSGSLFGGYNSGGSIPGFTNYHVIFTDLNFNVETSNDTSNLHMIDGRHFMGLQINHVWVGGGGDKAATGSSVGVAFPLILNNVENVVSDGWVTGFFYNWSFSEHTHVREAYSVLSPNCFLFDDGTQSVFNGYTGNTIMVDYIWSQTCGKGIVSGGGSTYTPVHISAADIESTDTMISDPGNNLHGYLGILQPYAPYTITQNGGFNLAVFDIAHSTFLKLNANVLVGGNVNNTSTFTPQTNGNIFNVSGPSTLGPGNVGQQIVLVNSTGTTQTITGNGATINGAGTFSMDQYKRNLLVVNPTSQTDWLVVVY